MLHSLRNESYRRPQQPAGAQVEEPGLRPLVVDGPMPEEPPMLSDQEVKAYKKKYIFRYAGRNSRLDEMQAAVLDVKLKYLDADNLRRKTVAHYYYDHIKHPLVSLPDFLPDEQNVYHLFPVLVGGGQRDALHDYLEQRGVGTVCHYPIAPHQQECYSKAEWNVPQLRLPITEQLAGEELSLPISPAITAEEIGQVVDLINKFS